MLWLTRRVASFLTDNQAGIRSFPGPRFRVVLAQSGGKWDQPDNLTDQTGLRIIALCRHSGDPASLAMVALASSGNRIPGKSRREDLRRVVFRLILMHGLGEERRSQLARGIFGREVVRRLLCCGSARDRIGRFVIIEFSLRLGLQNALPCWLGLFAIAACRLLRRDRYRAERAAK